MITLLSVVGDSDVRPKHTEVGKGVPLTSPFIEEIYGEVRGDAIPEGSVEFALLAQDTPGCLD